MNKIFPSGDRLKICAFLFLTAAFVFLSVWRPVDSSPVAVKDVVESDTNAPAEFAAFDLWMREYFAGSASGELLQKGEELAARRRPFFKRLIETAPHEAIRLAIDEQNLNRLPYSVARHLEKSLSLTGDFLVRVEDEIDPTGEFHASLTMREIVFENTRYKAFVYGRKSSMTTKYNVPLRVVRLDDAMAVDENSVRKIEPIEYSERNVDRSRLGTNGAAAEIGGRVVYFSDARELEKNVFEINAWEEKIAPAPSADLSSWTEGPKTVLFIRVDFAERQGEPTDAQGAPLTVERAQNLINNPVNQFFTANSYNKTSLTATVTPVIRMPQPQSFYAGSNSDLIFTHAREAARAAGFETNNYNLDIIAWGSSNLFGYAGFARIGDKGLVLNGAFDFKTAAHELGHCYGLLHANSWRTTDGTVTGAGANVEYGDAFDVMGGGGTQLTHFNAGYKRNLDWLTDANVQTIATSGVYRVHAFDVVNAPQGIHLLKIKRDGVKNYLIEFRQQFTSTPSLMNGAMLRWDFNNTQNNRRQTQVLDMTPSTQTLADSTLLIGQTFHDQAAGLSMTILGRGGTTPESLDVKIEFNFSQIRGAAFDFDGDNKSDIGVFRPAQGVWYLNNSTSAPSAVNWGISEDKIAPAKFNSDRTTDLAVYRAGTWYVYNSLGGQPITVRFGTGEDLPFPADYDGDGFAEMAVYRPSNGTWHMWNWVFQRYSYVQFGLSSDVPVPGDYDGDGKTDVAVWRPATGVWYVWRSGDGGYTIQAFGLGEDRPVPADFDGDGQTDIGVFRPSTGEWYVSRSVDNALGVFRFGLAEDVPAPADYDGDGRADHAVFRPSTGTWYLQRSSLGFMAEQYGLAGDKPVAAAFGR